MAQIKDDAEIIEALINQNVKEIKEYEIQLHGVAVHFEMKIIGVYSLEDWNEEEVSGIYKIVQKGNENE